MSAALFSFYTVLFLFIKVADGEKEWVALFFYVCPFSDYFAAFEQFRSRMTVEDSVFTRTINYRYF